MIRKKLWMFFLLFLIFMGLSGCGTKETLQVGVNKGYKPFGFTENDGKPNGFEIELWKEIAKNAGLKYELRPMSNGEMLSALQNGQLDIAIAGITVKENRKKIVDFSTPYLHTGQALLVKEKNKTIQTLKHLKNKTVAVKTGTTGYEYASKVKGIKEIKAFPDVEDAFNALLNDEADAVIYDAPGIHYFVKHEGKGKVKSVGNLLTKEHYSLGLKKGSIYTGRINNALRELADNGTFEKVYKKWFEQAPESLPE